jgi:hypothetical protein
LCRGVLSASHCPCPQCLVVPPFIGDVHIEYSSPCLCSISAPFVPTTPSISQLLPKCVLAVRRTRRKRYSLRTLKGCDQHHGVGCTPSSNICRSGRTRFTCMLFNQQRYRSYYTMVPKGSSESMLPEGRNGSESTNSSESTNNSIQTGATLRIVSGSNIHIRPPSNSCSTSSCCSNTNSHVRPNRTLDLGTST